jgi:hypothetical protein
MNCEELGRKHAEAEQRANESAAQLSEAMHNLDNALTPEERVKLKIKMNSAASKWRAAEAAEVRARTAYQRCLTAKS